MAVNEALITYCIDVLQSRGRSSSDDYTPSDCADYLLNLDGVAALGRDQDGGPAKGGIAGSKRDGSEGPSVAGGVGGRGGRAGSGPGGGGGGAGGAGVSGGVGGRGGAGGASD